MRTSDAEFLDDDDQELWDVEKIVKAVVVHRGKGNKIKWKYLVKWDGYDEEENTLEPPESFESCPELLRDFWKRIDTGGRNKDKGSLFRVGEEFFPDFPFVDVDEEDEREYQERKRRREMKAKEHSRKRTRLSSEEEPEFVKHKRQSVNGHRSKSQSFRVVDSSSDSDDRPLQEKAKGKATQRNTTARPANVRRPSKGRTRLLEEREATLEPHFGLRKKSVTRTRERSTESDHAGSLFSGSEDSEEPGPSSIRAGPSTDLPAALRGRMEMQKEAERSGLPQHRLRKQVPLVKFIEPHELLAAGGSNNNQDQDHDISTQAEVATASAVTGSSRTVETQQSSPSRRPLSIMTIGKGGAMNVVQTKDGHYIQKRPLPSKRMATQRVEKSPQPPESVRDSSTPDVAATTVQATVSDIESMGMIGGSTLEASPAEEPQPMDIFDDFVYLSDSPPPSHLNGASRHILDLPTPLTVQEVSAQPMYEEDHLSYSPPHSSANKLFLQSDESSPPSARSSKTSRSSASELFTPSKVIGPLADNFNPDSPMGGISLSMADFSQNMSQQLLSLARNEKTDIRMPLRLGPSSKLTIALRDVRPPTAEAAHRLAMLVLENQTPATVVYSQSDGLPGKLYPHGVLRAIKAQNLSARVILASGTPGQQTKDFDKLLAALEKDKVFIFTLPRSDNASLFVLCSSKDKEAVKTLGIPDDLVGLDHVAILQNISINDDIAYVVFALEAEDLQLN